MKIGFDLDNTLIRAGFDFPLEASKRKLLAQFYGAESLRLGTVEIFNFCKSQGWETWIYTSSFRNPFYLRFLFWLHGISLDGVVNYEIHYKKVKLKTSKHPPSFGIDILIDDSEGVRIEGERFDFKVILVYPENENWVNDLKLLLLTQNIHQ